jgi:hypothetical protein
MFRKILNNDKVLDNIDRKRTISQVKIKIFNYDK